MNTDIVTHPGRNTQDPSSSGPINIQDHRGDNKIAYAFCAVSREMLAKLYGDPAFDFGKRDLRVILCILNKMLGLKGQLWPVRLSNQDIVEATHIKKNAVSETMVDLMARRIVTRDNGVTGINPDLAQWLAKVPETGTPEFPKQELRVPETGTPSSRNRNSDRSFAGYWCCDRGTVRIR